MCIFNPPADINVSAYLGLTCKIPFLPLNNSFRHSRKLYQTLSYRTERRAEPGSVQKVRAEVHYSLLSTYTEMMEEEKDKEASGNKRH